MKSFILALVLGAISMDATAALVRLDFAGELYAIEGSPPLMPTTTHLFGHAIYDDGWPVTVDPASGALHQGGGYFEMKWGFIGVSGELQQLYMRNSIHIGEGTLERIEFGTTTTSDANIDSAYIFLNGQPLMMKQIGQNLPSIDDWNLNYATLMVGQISGPGWGAGFQLTDVSVSAVPIPATAWLLGSALGLLGWARRKSA